MVLPWKHFQSMESLGSFPVGSRETCVLVILDAIGFDHDQSNSGRG